MLRERWLQPSAWKLLVRMKMLQEYGESFH